MNDDPYCYPGTEILRNKFAILDEEDLKATEARVASLALFVLEDEPIDLPIGEDRFKAIHEAIFGELYDWAGSYRQGTGNMTKGREAGYQVTYGNSAFVPTEMTRIFVELQHENNLRGLSPDRFAARLTYFYSEIDGTHPFREGNSRTLRKFASDLAEAAGHFLDWEPTGHDQKTKNALYQARDFAAHRREYERLVAIIRENLHPLDPD